MYSPYYHACNWIDCDEISYDDTYDYYFCNTCLQEDQLVVDGNNYHPLQVYQPIGHYLFNSYCYEDCEEIEGLNLINGPDGLCECGDGFGWEDMPYLSACVSCD